jgi:hypothetical protein
VESGDVGYKHWGIVRWRRDRAETEQVGSADDAADQLDQVADARPRAGRDVDGASYFGVQEPCECIADVFDVHEVSYLFSFGAGSFLAAQ